MARRAAALRFRASCFGGALLAGPGDERATTAAWGRLRASQADREQVIGALKAAFVAGMLDKDELDRRVGQALVPQTYTELADLTADLPTGHTAAPERAPAGGGQPLLRPGQIVAGSTLLYAGAWLYAPNPRASALVVLGGFFYLCVLAIAVAVALENRLGARCGGGYSAPHVRGPARHDTGCHPPAHCGHLPPVASGHRHANELTPRRRAQPQLPRCDPAHGRSPRSPDGGASELVRPSRGRQHRGLMPG
jgi:hypothetical protein